MNTDNELLYIDSLNGDQFEIYMTKLLSNVGYQHMIHTPFVNDHGLDAYGYNSHGEKVGFQYKNYTNKVPYKAVYETLGGATFYRTSINYLITNSYFTKNTYRVCRRMNHNDPNHTIKLINRNGLKLLINKANFNRQSVVTGKSILDILSDKMTNNMPATQFNNNNNEYKVCPKCHTKLNKTAKFCHVCGYKFNLNNKMSNTNVTTKRLKIRKDNSKYKQMGKDGNEKKDNSLGGIIVWIVIALVCTILFLNNAGISFNDMSNHILLISSITIFILCIFFISIYFGE